MSTYFRDRILFENLGCALRDIMALEAATNGTPRYAPYRQAGDALSVLITDLKEGLRTAERNPYYTDSAGRKRPMTLRESIAAQGRQT